MSTLDINGRPLQFDAIKKLDKSEVKETIRNAEDDGRDNVVFQQGRDTFIASSSRDLPLRNVKEAGLLSKGGPASLNGQTVRIQKVDDELLSPLSQALKVAHEAADTGQKSAAEAAFLRAVVLSK